MKAPYLPDTAPFSPEQRAWLNGYFAALVRGATTAAVPIPAGDGRAGTPPLPRPAATPPATPRYDRANPFAACLLACRRLTGEGSGKDVRHVELSLEGSGLTYEAGDALGVFPRNDPTLVAALLDALGHTGDEAVPVKGGAVEVTLREALAAHLDVGAPSKAFLESCAARAGDDDLRALLAPERRDDLAAFTWGRDVLDLIAAYPGLSWAPAGFAALLRPLQHRLYSIASGPAAHPGRIHLTVGTVRYAAHGRARGGVCSTFLADRIGKEDTVPVFVHRNAAFRLPADPATPVIMVGPGTGVAPFRAFLQERRARGGAGPAWLFFGERHAATDFLYRDAIEAFLADGTLTRLDTAFSRDQADKVYVQHRMAECGADLFDWLEAGAHLYVCGDASRMAKDVDDALHRVVEAAGGRRPDESAAYVRRLRQEKRYARDVY